MVLQIRKFNRHRNFNYSLNGCYFVTICVKGFICFFGKIENDRMMLNKRGEIVRQQLLWLPKQFPYVRLGEWCIMPNHVHIIIVIDRFKVGTGLDLSLPKQKVLSLSHIVGAFKTISSKQIHQLGLKQFCWQRSFFDRVIRNNSDELERISSYIQSNPQNWHKDRNNPVLFNKNSDILPVVTGLDLSLQKDVIGQEYD